MKKLSITLALLFFGLTLVPVAAMAQQPPTPNSTQTFPASPSGTQGIPPPNGTQSTIGGLTNPLGSTGSFCQLIKQLLNILILFGIPIATFFVMYAGFKLVMARGNPEELKKARNNLFYTVVGIAIFLSAWLLGQIIASTIKDLNVDVPGLNNC